VYEYVRSRPTVRNDPNGLGPILTGIYATACFIITLKGAHDWGEDIADDIYGNIDITTTPDGTIFVDGEESGHVPETPAERQREERERQEERDRDNLDQLKGLPGIG